MGLRFEIAQHPVHTDEVRIALRGEIDMAAQDELFEAILAAVRSGAAELAIDLREVTFFDSAAVGVLVAGRNAARHAGCAYRILNPPELVRRVLETTGILELLTGPGTQIQARESRPAGHPAPL